MQSCPTRLNATSVFLMSILFVCFSVSIAPADVVRLHNGTQQQGLVVRDHPDEPKITLRTTAGEVGIPRSRIAQIEKESVAASHIRLGDQYLAIENFSAAAEQFQKALGAEPDNAEARERLEQAQAGQQGRRQEERQLDEARVDQVLGEVRQLVEKRDFDNAIKQLKTLNMGYGTTKAPEVRKVYADTYIAWAAERLDRQDPGGAAEKLQFALRLDPSNQTARQLLMRAYQGNPGKLSEIADFYKDSSDPDEQLRRADALFRLRKYEEALPLYLQFAADPQRNSELVRERVRIMFDSLHRQSAEKGDYEGALRWYQAFSQFDSDISPLPMARYEYMIQQKQIDQNDPASRAALAEFAEQRGMPETARKEFLNVLSMQPEQPQALAGIRRFAVSDLQDARAFFSQGQYMLANAKAQTIVSTYPMLPDVVQEAQQIQTKSEVEQGKVNQSRLQQGVALAERGDRYYEQALSYMSAMVSNQIDRSVRAFSPRQEAIKYLGWAIFSWQSALQIDPALGDPTAYDLYRKIADASAKYATLANRVAPALPRLAPELSHIQLR